MRDPIEKVNHMDREHTGGQMERCIRVIGWMELNMGKVIGRVLRRRGTKENGRQVRLKDLEYYTRRVEIGMRVCSSNLSNMGWGRSSMSMKIVMKECLIREDQMEMVNTSGTMGAILKVNICLIIIKRKFRKCSKNWQRILEI